MEKSEFISLVGKDVVIEYPFFGETQKWSMKNFYLDENGEPHHSRLNIIMDVFITNARNPQKGEPTHG